MRSIPKVEVIGMYTSGGLSDVLEKVLPNGWVIKLSNEIYYSHDGICFESRDRIGDGIKPDVEIDWNIKSFVNNGRDEILERAFK